MCAVRGAPTDRKNKQGRHKRDGPARADAICFPSSRARYQLNPIKVIPMFSAFSLSVVPSSNIGVSPYSAKRFNAP